MFWTCLLAEDPLSAPVRERRRCRHQLRFFPVRRDEPAAIAAPVCFAGADPIAGITNRSRIGTTDWSPLAGLLTLMAAGVALISERMIDELHGAARQASESKAYWSDRAIAVVSGGSLRILA